MLLLTVVETGEEEEDCDQEGELGVGDRVDLKLNDSVHEPSRTSDKPDPRGLSHRSA